MDVTLWLYLAVAVPYSLFVILYSTRSPWYETWMGRSLLLSKAVIAALAINAVLALLFGDYPGREWVRAFCVGGAIVAGWTQLILLILEQRRDRKAPVNESQSDRSSAMSGFQGIKFEPALVRAVWVAIVALLGSFGVTLNNDLPGGIEAALVAASVILPAVQGFLTRAKVVPVAKLDPTVP